MDLADADRPIAPGTRKNYPNRTPFVVLCERAKKSIDRQRILRIFVFVRQQQPPIADDHLLFGRNQIDRVRLDQHSVFNAVDLQPRVSGQQFIHQAAKIG